MYKCDRCGKEFYTSRALGGHRSYCGSQSVSESVSGSHSLTGLATTHSLTKPLTHSLRRTEASPIVRQAEEVGKRYQLTGKRFGQVQIHWGRAFAAAAVAGLVFYLIYKALENWDWKGGSSRKQVSPYKLIGGLVSGLG